MARAIGLGCMRLSTPDEPDGARALETLLAALDAGATLLDTAGAYGKDEHDAHGNERLIRRALEAWSGDRGSITIATKGGLVRAGERFVCDGRATALRAACDASLEALGVDALDLFLLHAIDPRNPLETSVRALAGLRDAGRVRAIGLSNVSLAELDRARAITEIAAVEVALSPFDDHALRGGLVARCAERGIVVLAHSPLGGPKRAAKLARDPVLTAVAARHGATPAQIAIAWLRDLSPAIVPIPGSRTPHAARDAIAAARLTLDDRDRAELDARFPAGARVRPGARSRRPRDDAPGEVAILMGIQGAGKSTLARELVDAGYLRLNRDEQGGTLRGLVALLRRALADGATRVVLDNTYPTRASRNEVVEAAWEHGIPVRCTWIDAPIEVAQANVVGRILEGHGRLLEPHELETRGKKDPSVVPPRALHRFRRELERPSREEGFGAVEVLPFARRARPDRDRAGVIVALDAIASIAPPYQQLEIDHARVDALRGDHVLAALGWTPAASPADRARRDAMLEQVRALGIDVRTCGHPAGPPVCWCRPPLPGLAVALVHDHRLDVARTIVVGTHALHRTLAEAIGARYEPPR